MTNCKITFVANAGCAIDLGGVRIHLDVWTSRTGPGYSSMTDELFAETLRHPDFQDAAMMIVSHYHHDHFSGTRTAAALTRSPRATVYLPEKRAQESLLTMMALERPEGAADGIAETPEIRILNGDNPSYEHCGVRFDFRRLRHMGDETLDLPNYGCMISSDDFRILTLGDAALDAPGLAEWIGEKTAEQPIDLALLNFPWIGSNRSRAFLTEKIRAPHFLIFHLPFEKDDEYRYRASAIRKADLHPIPGLKLLLEPFQTEVF